MNCCPITYELCGKEKYSLKGLRRLSPRLQGLRDFPLSAEEQRQEAAGRADKMYPLGEPIYHFSIRIRTVG